MAISRPSILPTTFLQPIDASSLYQRRVPGYLLPSSLSPLTSSYRMLERDPSCRRCHLSFSLDEPYLLVGVGRWHSHCFRCAQCFDQLADSDYFMEGGRFYCERDFRRLYAPVCQECKEDIIGHVVKVATGSYHGECIGCQECRGSLDMGVWVVDGRLLCYDCKENIPRDNLFNCAKCRQSIDRHELLRYKQEIFHAYHFNCTDCGVVLESTARQMKEELFCPRCYDIRSEQCAGCKRPIDRESDRSTFACGKHWHIDHFRCVHCGEAFHGKEYLERKGKAYCRGDYVKLFGETCFVCGEGLTQDSIRIFGKGWCTGCYSCCGCHRGLSLKDKVREEDLRPLCKRCYSTKSYKKVLEERAKRK